jgi:hypothetical protein
MDMSNVVALDTNEVALDANICTALATANEIPILDLQSSLYQDNKGKLVQLLETLENKYKDNEYMLSRLYTHIETLLPSTLEAEYKIQQQREERKRDLTSKRNHFIERFLHKYRYFYCDHSGLFIHYDGKHYTGYSEDDILHKIHSLIVSEQSLMVWKYKIKINIMKQIREKSLFTAIPESDTIQFVINSIYPSIFQTRNSAKYFLTIIGECIVNQPKNIYITSPNMKVFLDELALQLDTYFGLSYPFHNIKYKYYDHDYSLCRIIPFSKTSFSVPYNVSKFIFDFLCVSAHYISRYENPDHFLSQLGDTDLLDYSHFMCKNTPDKIVDMFIDTTIKKCPSAKISTKNILFIWKKFLEEKNVPNVILHGPLKKLLREKIAYNSETDMFMDVTSLYLPVVSQFIHFWDTYISEDENEPEIEIDELMRLFRKTLPHTKMNDLLMIELIRHFYPDIEIQEDKYIINIRCSLWNKRCEVKNALELWRTQPNYQSYIIDSPSIGANDSTCTNCAANCAHNRVLSSNVVLSSNAVISSNVVCAAPSPIAAPLYEAYEFYCKSSNDFNVSKRYFEKVAREVISDYLDNDGFVTSAYFMV